MQRAGSTPGGPPWKMIRWQRPLAIAVLCLVSAGAVRAHPHAWIGLELEALADRPGQLDGFAITWRFDPLYTLLLTEDMPAAGDERQDSLDRLGARIMESIAAFDYLLFVEQPVTASGGGEAALQAVSMNAAGELVLQFERRFGSPLDLSRDALRYRIYDPAFYIQMSHDSAAAVQLGTALGHCSVDVAPARPDPAAFALAAELDIGGGEAEAIGRLFAETVTIACP